MSFSAPPAFGGFAARVFCAILLLMPCLFVLGLSDYAMPAQKTPVEIGKPFNSPGAPGFGGENLRQFGYWHCFTRGNRFNMYTESRDGTYMATLIMSLRNDGATNMRVSISSRTMPPEDYPQRSEVEAQAGGETLHLQSINETEIRLAGYGYVFDFVSDSPQMLDRMRSLMLANQSITFILGDNDFITKFSLDGFPSVIQAANEWFDGRNPDL